MVEIEIIPESIVLLKMSDEEYFSEKYRNFISNSRLGYINSEEGGSQEKFLGGFKSTYSDSFELGSAVHALVLQEESYFVSKCNKPTGKLGEFINEVFRLRNNTEKKYTLREAIEKASIVADYYAGKLSATRLKTAMKGAIEYYLDRLRINETSENKAPLFLSTPMKEKLEQCMLGISENKAFIQKLKPEGLLVNPTVLNEYAIFCEVKMTIDGVESIVKLKGKLDNVTIDEENQIVTLNDLKTTGKPVKFFMGNWVTEIDEDKQEIKRWYNGSFQKYHYYRQMALYIWLLQAALRQYYGIEYKLEANMLVVETTPNFKSAIYKVNGKYITEGLKEFKALLTAVVQWNLQTKI